ncbi:MAG: hypothetical protein ABGZ17_23960 [Planctomycetaceae bacterium]
MLDREYQFPLLRRYPRSARLVGSEFDVDAVERHTEAGVVQTDHETRVLNPSENSDRGERASGAAAGQAEPCGLPSDRRVHDHRMRVCD